MKQQLIILITLLMLASCQNKPTASSPDEFQLPAGSEKPWVYWFLTDASISEKGITTDLKAMKDNGIGGAFLFTIRGAAEPSLYEPTVVQLTPEWWKMMKYAVSEADRIGIKLAFHACDGFTAAGGPWITPELSMQKLVWTDTIVGGNQHFEGVLPQPEMVEDYYRDIATFAYPVNKTKDISTYEVKPEITTSFKGKDASFLTDADNTKNFTTREKGWIQYAFNEPFTCKTITMKSGWNNYQANRLILETSNDGIHFKRLGRLEAYRHGWDDRNVTVTHLIEEVKARYFRFVFDPEGSEPGSEDLDDAKWRPRLKISGIKLSDQAKIHQFEGKSGAVWRISNRTNPDYLSENDFIDPNDLINITEYLDADGKLSWNVPNGNWKILRMGHTSTGATNYIGGGGKGLEADKLNPEAVKVQFNNWFDSIYNYMGDELAENVIEELYNDSWECGSQNWSPVLAGEFEKRRGYNIKDVLPVMAGVPVKSTEFSEKVLYDARQTIAEVLVDNYHGTMAKLAHDKGCRYSAESVAPVFVSDGMLHFKSTDAPTGEFWFRSPSHDKPNDILDAVSAAHVYGKKLVRAEAGTEIRIDWDEHPAMFKTLFDRNFAKGINKIIFHVFTHDPWTDRKPGKTLGVVGTFFQPNQTWWKPGKAWVKYIENCQTQLQQGVPVVDIAVFTGEEIPRRAILPDRLIPVLPGIFGEEKVLAEQKRLQNEGQPYCELPKGVTTQTNIADPVNWVDPLKGNAYDSFNKDVLLNRAGVKNGRIELPGGASYGLLVVPGKRKMNPENGMSLKVAQQILKLVKDGATVYFHEKPALFLGDDKNKEAFEAVMNELFSTQNAVLLSDNLTKQKLGKGWVLTGKYDLSSFSPVNIEKDFQATEDGGYAEKMAWTHRRTNDSDIYFVASQLEESRDVKLSFRVSGKIPELYNPVTGGTSKCNNWKVEDNRTIIPYRFDENESVFVIFKEKTDKGEHIAGTNKPVYQTEQRLEGSWHLTFDPLLGGPGEPVQFSELSDWSKSESNQIKYYSGTVVYRKNFEWNGSSENVMLSLGRVHNLAEIKVNEINCGVVWTAPYRVNISEALTQGNNQIEIAVTNTWANRLIGDHGLPQEEQITWTTCAWRLEGVPLLPAGLLGPVEIMTIK
jgi:hypothetical protein